MKAGGSRAKGNTYEVAKGDELATWQGYAPKVEQVPVKGKAGKLRTQVTRSAFYRSPGSGGWSAKDAPHDLIIPPEFVFGPEMKSRASINFESLMLGRVSKPDPKGKKPPSVYPLDWLAQAVRQCRREARQTGKPERIPMVVCKRNGGPDWCLVPKNAGSAEGLLQHVVQVHVFRPAMTGEATINFSRAAEVGLTDAAVLTEAVWAFPLAALLRTDPELFRGRFV